VPQTPDPTTQYQTRWSLLERLPPTLYTLAQLRRPRRCRHNLSLRPPRGPRLSSRPPLFGGFPNLLQLFPSSHRKDSRIRGSTSAPVDGFESASRPPTSAVSSTSGKPFSLSLSCAAATSITLPHGASTQAVSNDLPHTMNWRLPQDHTSQRRQGQQARTALIHTQNRPLLTAREKKNLPLARGERDGLLLVRTIQSHHAKIVT